MDRENFSLIKSAYMSYNLKSEEMVVKRLLDYIRERLVANQSDLESIIKIYKEHIAFESILKIFDEEASKPDVYKKEKSLKKINDSFYMGKYTTSVGNVVVETSNALTVLKYFVRGIKSRNSITISDIEYEENDLKNCILMIFKSALEKYGYDPNLLSIEAFEECNYSGFDRVIIEFESRYVDNRDDDETNYIYVQSDKFLNEANSDYTNAIAHSMKVELLKGDFEDVMEHLKSKHLKSAVIYTEDRDKAYEFINSVYADNTFVNASLNETEDIVQPDNELYCMKKIIYPVN